MREYSLYKRQFSYITWEYLKRNINKRIFVHIRSLNNFKGGENNG